MVSGSYNPKLYERSAWRTMGVIEVENEIRVGPLFPVTDTAIERQIKDIAGVRS